MGSPLQWSLVLFPAPALRESANLSVNLESRCFILKQTALKPSRGRPSAECEKHECSSPNRRGMVENTAQLCWRILGVNSTLKNKKIKYRSSGFLPPGGERVALTDAAARQKGKFKLTEGEHLPEAALASGRVMGLPGRASAPSRSAGAGTLRLGLRGTAQGPPGTGAQADLAAAPGLHPLSCIGAGPQAAPARDWTSGLPGPSVTCSPGQGPPVFFSRRRIARTPRRGCTFLVNPE